MGQQPNTNKQKQRYTTFNTNKQTQHITWGKSTRKKTITTTTPTHNTHFKQTNKNKHMRKQQARTQSKQTEKQTNAWGTIQTHLQATKHVTKNTSTE